MKGEWFIALLTMILLTLMAAVVIVGMVIPSGNVADYIK